MKSFYLLYLPAILIFLTPVAVAIIKSILESRKSKQIEKVRRSAASEKAARKTAQADRREKVKKQAERSADPVPRRKRGRPRKNPPEQIAEIISPASNPDPVRPASLPTSCTPEEFAAWIERANRK